MHSKPPRGPHERRRTAELSVAPAAAAAAGNAIGKAGRKALDAYADIVSWDPLVSWG
jgi:hypothetical protein